MICFIKLTISLHDPMQHPGNISVDDFNGGRLIFYDFGMMGSISQNIREGLLEVFHGVYEKDPEKVLQAMVQMGFLVPTGDMTAVRRTAQFFLNSFEERLAQQRKEREMALEEELGFKKPLSKDEKIEKKKQRLPAIGEDLLSIVGDQPFRFPATFTFVVRAFSVLDGIGKGLDTRFDITEIAQPYALEVLKFREAGVEVILKDFRWRWDRQSQAVFNLFRQADRVEKLAEVIQRLEQGDLKLRVRTLESERAFQRVAAVQNMVGSTVAAGSLINLATILYINSIKMPATIAYILCAFFSLKVLIGMVKVKKLDEREKLITNNRALKVRTEISHLKLCTLTGRDCGISNTLFWINLRLAVQLHSTLGFLRKSYSCMIIVLHFIFICTRSSHVKNIDDSNSFMRNVGYSNSFSSIFILF